MALKSDRSTIETEITRICPSVAERGVVLVTTTSGSGTAIGDRAGVADLVTNPSGYRVAGLLMSNVVNIDLTRFHLSFHNDERQIGSKVTLLRKGRVTTNKVTGTPTDGATAYLTANGVLTPTRSATGGDVATPKVGVFAGAEDEDGYATVDFNLPIA